MGVCTHFLDNRHFSDRTIGTVLLVVCGSQIFLTTGFFPDRTISSVIGGVWVSDFPDNKHFS